jgi:hypothetical protein
MTGDGWSVVIPAKGEAAATARALLALASHPSQVRSQRGGAEFLVPDALAALYGAPAPVEEPKPRAPRGRAKKESS